jgi:hypothetical protein
VTRDVSTKVARTLEIVERVNRSLDEKGGPVADARRRERQRVNRALGKRLASVGVAVGVISLLTIIIGLIVPIGMFGFLAAVGIAVGIAALLFFWPGDAEVPTVPKDVGNAEMVQRFDSFLYRSRAALPAPAQAVVDGLSSLGERLAKRDMDAFQTHGRFIKTRYGETESPTP